MVTTVIGVLLIIMAVFLVIAVLMQSSKDHRLGASIAGGAETFFGKQKGKSMDALFNKLTTVIAIVFVVLVLVLYFLNPGTPKTDDILGDVDVELGEGEIASDANIEEVASDANLNEENAGTDAPEAEADAPEAEADAPEAEADAPEAEADAPEAEADAPEAETPAA